MSRSRTATRRADLLDQRDALLRSLEDLDRELSAGDLDGAAYRDLRAIYVGRTAEVIRALGTLDSAPATPVATGTGSGWSAFRRVLGRRGVRSSLAVGSAICVLGAIVLVVLLLAGVRLPGQGETGGVVIPKASQVTEDLDQAAELASGGDVSQAIELYDVVLRDVPNQPVALTYKGWLERLSGIRDGRATLVEQGDASLADAVRVAPTYADAVGLYGVALLQDGGAKSTQAALDAFRTFCLTPQNTAVLQAQGSTMAAAFVAAHETVPNPLKPYLKATSTAGGSPSARA